jgi:hypothetical protein
MPDVQDGLELDVNTQDGFEAALAKSAGVEVSPEASEGKSEEDLSVAAGLAQSRDDQGRFTPAAPVVSEGDTEVVPAEGQTTEEVPGDPAVTALLEKHGGDTVAALADLAEQHANAESLIGKQGQELGEARALNERIAKLEGQLEAAQTYQAPQSFPLPASDEVVSGLENLYESRGAQGMMAWVAENNPDLIESAIEVWSADDPLAAQRFAVKYDRALEESQKEPAATLAPASDPFIDQLKNEAQFSSAVASARQSLGIADTDWDAIRTEVIPAFEDEATSPLIKNAIVADDATTRQQGMEALLQIARGRAVSAATTEATAKLAEDAGKQATERKLAATVATGSLRPAERQPDSQESREDAIGSFKKSLLDTETTSVEEGLRQGLPK